jgi:hypothetical protein
VMAARDALAVVDRIDLLRQDADDLALSGPAKASLLGQLDKKAAHLLQGEPYRIARWFEVNGDRISWLVGPTSIEPLLVSQFN